MMAGLTLMEDVTCLAYPVFPFLADSLVLRSLLRSPGPARVGRLSEDGQGDRS